MKWFLTLLVGVALVTGVSAAEKSKSTTKKKSEASKPAKSDDADAPKVPAKLQEAADSLTAAQKKSLLALLNDGTETQLERLPGLGDTRAKGVIKARPMKEVTDLLKVDGVGEGTFTGIIAVAKKGVEQPEEAKKKSTPKSTKKKTTK
jgi:DNA uptake protein ComE-like DNA-binding protein